MKNQTLGLLLVFIVVLVGSGLLVYGLLGGVSKPAPQTRPLATASPELTPTARPGSSETSRETRREGTGETDSFIARIFESRSAETATVSEGWGTIFARITLRLLLATLLGAALAFRPRKQLGALRRNPYVGQTQILLAIVASALMMIVGDNAARAFGIFAAVSLVRFRTNIRDPKEISVLLISLALGLATGVGRPELAVILCLFVLAILWILERTEPSQVFRAMELKVATNNTETSQRALGEILRHHGFSSELRALGRDGKSKGGEIVYYVDVSPLVSTDKLSDDILSLDPENIVSIEWDQKKSSSYIYQ